MKARQTILTIVLSISSFALMPLAHGQAFELLHTFQGSDGAAPGGALLQARDGDFYGTTARGGDQGMGTVFRLTTNGTLTTLVSFNGTNGRTPTAGLVQAKDGNFYGVTTRGGTSDFGTIFQVTPGGALTSLFSFNGTNGSYPEDALLKAADGQLYGATFRGGATDSGTIFKISTNGSFTTLITLNGTNLIYPNGGLIQGGDGNFYGTTLGNDPEGTVFRMTPAGELTILASAWTLEEPNGSLVWGTDGALYGTTAVNGGIRDAGTVFRVGADGTLSTFFTFAGTNGSWPAAGLLLGLDGNFYGTTSEWGPEGWGEAFQLTPNGVLTILHAFDCAEGASPYGELVQGSDGHIYGTSSGGGGGCLSGATNGIIFRIVMPSLSLSQSGTNVILSWPTNQAGLTLQCSGSCSAAAGWTDFPTPPSIGDGRFTVTNGTSTAPQFYRLKGKQ